MKLIKNRTVLFMILTLMSSTCICVSSQTQQSAQLEIQEADDRLIEVIRLLEAASAEGIDIRDLVGITDNARSLISQAKEKYSEANYTIAYNYAYEANQNLGGVIEEIEKRNGIEKQNKTILFSLLGVFSAILVGITIFFIIKWGYPWYQHKRREEYGKLEIQYEEENEGGKK